MERIISIVKKMWQYLFIVSNLSQSVGIFYITYVPHTSVWELHKLYIDIYNLFYKTNCLQKIC